MPPSSPSWGSPQSSWRLRRFLRNIERCCVLCLQQFVSQIYANNQRLQLQGAAANMSVTQMKQFVANDLRAMKTQSKAVALHISASEVRSCLQNFLFFRARDRFYNFDTRCMIFVKLFRQSRGKKVTALRFSFPWSIVWYKHKSLKDGGIK